MKLSKKVLNLLLVAILAAGMVMTTGCSKKSSPADSLVLTINDQNIYLDEMMYYIAAVEASGAQFEQMYQLYYDMSYWDAEFEEGKPVREQAKEYAMDAAIKYEISYDQALKYGLTLTDEEKEQAETNAETILSDISDELLEITGFTKDVLIRVQEKILLGEKYYRKVAEGLDIDRDAITATINYDDHRQYDTEYIFAATVTVDDSYNTVDLSDEEKEAARVSITKAFESAKEGKAFSDIVAEDDTLTTDAADFVYEDGSIETEYQDAAIKLDNDTLADEIIVTEYGYYIIKMIDNNSSESYDTAVSDAISVAEEEGFNTEYEIIKEEYTTTINDKVWDTIVMGETTVSGYVSK